MRVLWLSCQKGPVLKYVGGCVSTCARVSVHGVVTLWALKQKTSLQRKARGHGISVRRTSLPKRQRVGGLGVLTGSLLTHLPATS